MNTRPLRIGLKLGQDAGIVEMREIWRIADDAGFDHLWCLDLFAAINEPGPDRPIFEGWALQAAMAAATSRIRIGCAFTGNTHRPPWQLAKLAVTVDHLSGGRLEFGIGAGYEEVEHRMYDIRGLDHRVGRLSESLECLKHLWTEDRVNFEGRYYTLRDAIANPKPVQHPYPPIWMGAGGEQMMRVAARHADAWNCPFYGANAENEVERFVAAVEKMNELCVEIGRDPKAIRHVVQIAWDGKDKQRLVESCATWLAAGSTEQIIYLHPLRLDPLGTVRAAEIAAETLSELRTLAS